MGLFYPLTDWNLKRRRERRRNRPERRALAPRYTPRQSAANILLLCVALAAGGFLLVDVPGLILQGHGDKLPELAASFGAMTFILAIVCMKIFTGMRLLPRSRSRRRGTSIVRDGSPT